METPDPNPFPEITLFPKLSGAKLLEAAKNIAGRLFTQPLASHGDHFLHIEKVEEVEETLPPPDHYDNRGYPQWTLASDLEVPNRWDSLGDYTRDAG